MLTDSVLKSTAMRVWHLREDQVTQEHLDKVAEILTADYEGLERMASAHDIHTLTASEMFGVNPEQVTDEQRRAAKARNFMSIYGGSRRKAHQTLNYVIQGANCLRPCMVSPYENGIYGEPRPAIFHGFFNDSEGPLAIVELPDGSVKYAAPDKVQFIDRGSRDEDRGSDDVS